MAFRTLEISNPAELHIKNGQLEIMQEDRKIMIPLEDLVQIFCIGPNIRMSTKALSMMALSKVAVTTLDEKYLPTAIVLPFEGNARQSQLMHLQILKEQSWKKELWLKIIFQKICNQSKALALLGLEGSEKVLSHALNLAIEEVDYKEAISAKEYFSYYHPGLNRRTDDPMNSRLNYGYAVMRSAIIRALSVAGFHPTFGIHHDNQLNAFNLPDDFIEPWRPMVDLVAYKNIGNQIKLNKTERYELAHVLHNACMIGGHKMTILSAISVMCESLKQCYLENDISLLQLPTVAPVESMELVNE